MTIIIEKCCARCTHAYVAPAGANTSPPVECRRNPPAAHPIIVMTPQRGPQVVGSTAIFPTVQPTWFCGQFSRLLSS